MGALRPIDMLIGLILTIVFPIAFYQIYKEYNVELPDLLDNDNLGKKLRVKHVVHKFYLPLLMKYWEIRKFFNPSLPDTNQRLFTLVRNQIDSGPDQLGSQTIQTGVTVEMEQIASTETYIVTPTNTDVKFTMFYYHGGGWTACTAKKTYFQMIQNLSKKLCARIVCPEYRLAPENPYPAAFDDCYNTTFELLKRWNCEKYVLSGDSAGGNLLIAVAMKLSTQPDLPKVDLVAPIYPTYQYLNFDLPSFKEKSVAAFIETELIIRVALSYAVGICTDEMIAQFKSGSQRALLEPPNTNCLKNLNCNATSNSGNLKQNKTLAKVLNDKYFHPMIASDDDLKKLLDFIKIGVFTIVCEHDILRDEGIILMKRLESLSKNKLFKTVILRRAYHGVFTYGNYSATDVSKLERSTEKDKACDDWCDEVVNLMNK